MLRVCEIKAQLIEHNPRTGSLYVHLDSLLFDLKYDPSIIEIPVPRYFKECNDNIEVNIAFKEAVNRGGGPKVSKKKVKKKGKKKKVAEVEEEVKMSLKKMTHSVRTAYRESLDMKEPDIVEEKSHDLLEIPLSQEHAIRLIQNNERGRQGIWRIKEIRKVMAQRDAEKLMLKAVSKGKNIEGSV
jgi:hypothetical protein